MRRSLNKPRVLFCIIVLVVVVAACGSENQKDGVPFSYAQILKKEFKYDVGKAVPVTIEQALEMHGYFDDSGRYFFFTSNREQGNYDIYIRELSGIHSVRLTTHPSRDTSPAMSPSGNRLAFVSYRDDPEGDIFLMEIDPSEIVQEDSSSFFNLTMDRNPELNLTKSVEGESGRVRVVKDASPCWSKDGKYIAYSSARGGIENIWIMRSDGSEKRQVTSEGGMYPRFSRDGNYIIFISYRNEENRGDIYRVNTVTGEENQLIDTTAIELYPSFMNNINEIVFTRIDRDTNGDGSINLDDNSVLYYKNITNGNEYPLTLYSNSSFNAQWSPYDDGVLVYSVQNKNNLNINLIPDTGVIPKRDNARSQYDLAGKYLKEYDDNERYMAALSRVYDFHYSKKDIRSGIYITSALQDLAEGFHLENKKQQRDNVLLKIKNISTDSNDYPGIIYRYLALKFRNLNTEEYLQGIIEKLDEREDRQIILPYVMEELGQNYSKSGENKKAIQIYNNIITDHNSYNRLMHVYYSMAIIQTPPMLGNGQLPDPLIKVIESRYIYLKNDAITFLVSSLENLSGKKKKRKLTEQLLETYKSTNSLKPVLQYYLAELYHDKGDLSAAEKYCSEALSNVKKNDQVFYRSHVLLGSISEMKKNFRKMEYHYSEAANNYILLWQQSNITSIVKKLIDYYEEYGQRSELAGKYKDAVKLYKKYVSLLTRLHLLKKFEDIYNEYGARSHILYIDTFVESREDVNESLETLIEEYIGNRQQALNVARMDFKKAYLYGLGYIYTKKAVASANKKNYVADHGITRKENLTEQLRLLKHAMNQVEWANFIDDTFIPSFLLKGWIYQYVDMLRNREETEFGSRYTHLFDEYFPAYLWEQNISIYEKALKTNDEKSKPEQEGNLHLNLANVYFLLNNYPRSLHHFKKASEYKSRFESPIQEAMYHYHFGYCYWHNGNIERARHQLQTSLLIYRNLAGGNTRRYSNEIYNIYRYFALFDITEKNYDRAVTWLRRIMNFAKKNNISIDDARYLQNIAFCRNQQGKTSEALSYLASAEKLLKKYPSDSRGYRLMWRFFGVVPLKFYDLGPDVAVIGESKIFSELDTYTKKLLNISMQEDIHFNSGKYAIAIRHLKKKLELLEEEDNSVTRESAIKVMNNIGYCYFFMENYSKAEKFFQNAWDMADRDKMTGIGGRYEIIMNLAYMYSYILENKPGYMNKPDEKLNNLVDEIRKYREEYSKMRYRAALEELERKASARNSEVTEEEKEELKEEVAQETGRQYYRIDILLGMLKYYRAELFLHREIEKKAGELDAAYTVYKSNQLLYNQYLEALEDISRALDNMPHTASTRLEIKLLLNRAQCYRRLGFYQEAYEDYFSAEKKAESHQYNDLRWQVYGHTAEFLSNHGPEVAPENYRKKAEEYYTRSLLVVEDMPLRYSGKRAKVLGFYNGYIDLLLAGKKWQTAFNFAERKTSFNRIILIGSESPDLYDAAHDRMYRQYSYLLQEIVQRENELSAKLEKGAAPDSPVINQIRDAIGKNKSEMRNLYSRMKSSSPLLLSYIKIEDGNTVQNIRYDKTALRFHNHDGKKGCWKIRNGIVEFEYYSSSREEYLEKQLQAYSDPVVIASEDLDVDEDNNELKGILGNFNIIPSLSRLPLYQNTEGYPVTFITADKETLTRSILANVTLPSPDHDKAELERYNLVIDSAPSGFNITPGYLFSRRYLYPIIVKNTDSIDYEQFLLMMESSLYAQVQKIYITLNADDENIIQLARDISDTRKQVPGDSSEFTGRMLVSGFETQDIERTGRDVREQEEREWSTHEQLLKKGEYDSARNHLHRWYGYSAGEGDSHARYHSQLSEIYLYENKLEKAIEEIDIALEKSNDTEIENRIFSFKIYILLYSGNVQQARQLIPQLANDTGEEISVDVLVYRYILGIIQSGGIDSALSIYETDLKSYLNRDRLAILAAQYLSAYGNTENAVAIMEKWKPSYITTSREYIRAYFFGKKIEGETSRQPVQMLLSLVTNGASIEQLEEKARTLLTRETTPKLTDLLVLELMHQVYEDRGIPARSDFILSSLNLESIVSRAVWVDRLFYLRKMAQTMHRLEEYEKALRYVNLWDNAIEDQSPRSLVYYPHFRKAEILSKKEQFKESYTTCKKLLEDMSPIFPIYPNVQLLQLENEIHGNRIEDAKKRWENISPYISSELEYIYRLLKVRIDFMEIVAKGSTSDNELEGIEKTVREALDSIDANREQVSYPLRMDIVKSSLNVMMSFRMSRGNYIDALYYAEVIKQLELRSAMSLDIHGVNSGEDISNRFKILTKDSDGEEFVSLVRKNPFLAYSSIISMIPVREYQAFIPDDTVVMYMVKNHDDIFFWAIGPRSVNPGRIKGGFESIESWLEEYRDAASLLEPVTGFSARLQAILSPLTRYFKNKERVLFVVDNDLVSVPFEIMGERNMLAETHSVYYSSSILSSFIPSGNKFNKVILAGNPENSIATSLQNVAIKESGMKYESGEVTPGKAIHLYSSLRYNPVHRGCIMDDRKITEYFSGNPYLYLASLESAGLNLDTVLVDAAAINGCGNIIIDDLAVQDVNVAVFTNTLYSYIHKGLSVDRAFSLAKTAVIEDKRYKHPSFWEGLRLYVRPSDIDIMKSK